ncbi:MAG: glycosyltransferase family 39 protein, partial [Anaerolineae bacterium]|nr:glycosyltransferase family 39 protein [Anaerolineae bacterium]
MFSGKIQTNPTYWNSFPREKMPFVTLVFLLAFAVLVRFPFFDVPMITDEGGYAYVAHFWTDRYQLYRDIPFDRPQGIFLVYEFIFSFIGTDVESLRMGAALYNVGTVLVLFLFSRQVFDTRTAGISALLFGVMSASPSIEGFTANAELFASLPLTCAALLTWRKCWGWAGFFSGLAFLLKPIGLSGLVLVLVWGLITRASWRSSLRAMLAFSPGPLAMLAHGYFIGWNYFWNAVVGRKLVTDTVVSRDMLAQGINLLESVIRTSPAWLVLVALAAIAYASWSPQVKKFVWLWLLSSVFGMAIGGHWSRHYYVQLIPALSLMAGSGVVVVLRSSRRLLSYKALVITVAVFGVIELPLWFSTSETVSEIVYDRPGYVLNDEIAAYINERTAEDDTIYVAFYQAEIYYLAQRRNAVPQ